MPDTILVHRDVIQFVPNAKIAWHVWRTPEAQQMCAAASPDNTAHMADRLHSLRTGLNMGCDATLCILGDWTGPLSPRDTGSSSQRSSQPLKTRRMSVRSPKITGDVSEAETLVELLECNLVTTVSLLLFQGSCSCSTGLTTFAYEKLFDCREWHFGDEFAGD